MNEQQQKGDKMLKKYNIKNFTLEKLEDILRTKGFPRYRAMQVFKWVYKDVERFEEMTNLPGDLVKFLNEKFYIFRAFIIEKQISKDGTIKFLLELEDKNAIECVLMKYRFGYSVCISSQVGCRMGCKFCASTVGGLIRNLKSGEMVEQVMAVVRSTGIIVSNIVLMGIGEPFDNYEEVMKFLKKANHKDAFNLGMRHITISTSGLVPKIYKFADEKLQCNLAVSLHSSISSTRSEIMPINKKYNIEELIKACKYYIEKTNRRISFEYVLIQGINDNKADAVALSNLLKNMLCYVNLIPLNQVRKKGLIKSDDNSIEVFKNVLMEKGIHTTVRRQLGQDVDGACGQLRMAKRNDIQ